MINRKIYASWRGRTAMALAMALPLLGFVFLVSQSSAVALPANSPANCTDNLLALAMAKDVSATANGHVVHYQVRVSNNGGTSGCDIDGASVSFTAPAADGTATGVTTTLGTGLTFLASGANNTCWTSVASSCPAGFTEVVNGALAYTTAVNSGVHSAVAIAVQAGTNPPTVDCPVGAAVLHDGGPSNACASKTLAVAVKDAKILITPNGTNEINHPHTFTGHVDVDNGPGFVNAPDGTVIHFSIASGPGALTPGSGDCTTGGGTGSCTVSDTSTTPGVDTVNASTTVVVGGVSLDRTTDGSNGNSGPATKTWVDANIQISPLTDTDPINDTHTLTGHVNVNTGTGGYANAPAGTTIHFTIVSGPGSLTPVSGDCLTVLATGSCTVTLTSPSVGTTVVNASSAVVVGGVTLNRATGDANAGDSANASKTWTTFTAHVTTAIHSGATDSGAPVVVTSVPAGTTVHDSATVAGTNPGDPVPTGNVTFEFYTGPGTTACVEGVGVSAGTVALNGSGVADPSNAEGPLTPGQYYFQASYAGGQDANYPNGAISECEPLTVTQFHPSVTTTLSATTVNINTAMHDSATLIGASSSAGGTVSYHAYAGANSCSGTDLFGAGGNTKTVTNGIVPNSDDIAFANAGTYSFQATYSGDVNNFGPVSSDCVTEQLVVNQPQVATRTLGFWQTHTAFTESVFNGTSGGSVTLGGMVINTNDKLFGGFLAGISKKSDGTKRSALDQARMQLAQQWLAAELNCEAFTCPANITTLLGTASTHFASGTASQILADAGALDTYNNSGDGISTSLSVGSATPALSKSTANILFWNALN